jgi:putative nucleotidyltransferase with HDIG domain
MSDQTPNGRERGEAPRTKARFDIRERISAFSRGRYLPIGYLVLFVVLSLLLFPPMRKAQDIRFKEEDIADVDVIAPFDFWVPLSEQEIENNKANAAVDVPPVYARNEEAARHLPDNLNVFMEGIAGLARADSVPAETRLEQIRDFAPFLKNDPVELLLVRNNRRKILREGLRLQKEYLDRGIVNDATPLQGGNYRHITVVSQDQEKLIPTRPLIEQGQLEMVILGEAQKLFGKDDDAIGLFYRILRSHLQPNLDYDREETKRRRDEAEQQVPKAFKVSENQRIIAKHDKISKKQVDMLEALEEQRAEREMATSGAKRFMLFCSKALRIVTLLLLLGLSLYRFRRDLIEERDKLTLIFCMLTFYLLLTVLVIRLPYLDPYLIPVAFVALVSTAFFGVMTAMMFTLFAALMLITHTDLPASYTFVSILAGTAAIISIAQLRERKNFYRIFLYVSVAYIVGIAGFGMTEGMTASDFLVSALWGITNSFACTILVMFLLQIFESLFNVTTNFTLMELSDLNRPLLRRLIIEAPGTYHHALMVGNMVEAVAGDVGANSLLARVSAYYHDIGKLSKPEYFFENKGDNVNKHEKLAPTMSALILGSHVKEGVELAKNEKLPRVVVDAIKEHHGTTVMAYFYRKALEYDSHDSVNIDDFRYPGPRPRSKETALIMLADSSEAAVRSLKEPTAPRIRAIVSRIIEARMNDGELDQSGLTLNDIAIIREKFINLLTGIFHPRIQYPEQQERGEERVNDDRAKQPAQSNRKGRV